MSICTCPAVWLAPPNKIPLVLCLQNLIVRLQTDSSSSEQEKGPSAWLLTLGFPFLLPLQDPRRGGVASSLHGLFSEPLRCGSSRGLPQLPRLMTGLCLVTKPRDLFFWGALCKTLRPESVHTPHLKSSKLVVLVSTGRISFRCYFEVVLGIL